MNAPDGFFEHQQLTTDCELLHGIDHLAAHLGDDRAQQPVVRFVRDQQLRMLAAEIAIL